MKALAHHDEVHLRLLEVDGQQRRVVAADHRVARGPDLLDPGQHLEVADHVHGVARDADDVGLVREQHQLEVSGMEPEVEDHRVVPGLLAGCRHVLEGQRLRNRPHVAPRQDLTVRVRVDEENPHGAGVPSANSPTEPSSR